MDLKQKFGLAIVRLRKEKGLSQEQFANEAEIARRYMSEIENGRRKISLDVIERVAKALGIKVSELFAEAEK